MLRWRCRWFHKVREGRVLRGRYHLLEIQKSIRNAFTALSGNNLRGAGDRLGRPIASSFLKSVYQTSEKDQSDRCEREDTPAGRIVELFQRFNAGPMRCNRKNERAQEISRQSQANSSKEEGDLRLDSLEREVSNEEPRHDAGLETAHTAARFIDAHHAVWQAYDVCLLRRRNPDQIQRLDVERCNELLQSEHDRTPQYPGQWHSKEEENKRKAKVPERFPAAKIKNVGDEVRRTADAE